MAAENEAVTGVPAHVQELERTLRRRLLSTVLTGATLPALVAWPLVALAAHSWPDLAAGESDTIDNPHNLELGVQRILLSVVIAAVLIPVVSGSVMLGDAIVRGPRYPNPQRGGYQRFAWMPSLVAWACGAVTATELLPGHSVRSIILRSILLSGAAGALAALFSRLLVERDQRRSSAVWDAGGRVDQRSSYIS